MNAELISHKPGIPVSPCVLVVEDKIDNYTAIARLLAYSGIQKQEWKSSGFGVAQFADTLPHVDLILLDINLPGENGYEVLARLRRIERFQSTWIVAVTGDASPEEMRKAKDAGFNGFLSKPLTLRDFPGDLKKILSGEGVWKSR